MAMYNCAGLVTTCVVGIRPFSTAGRSGLAAMSSYAKHPPMRTISPATMHSSTRNPRCWSARTIMTSRAVMSTPHTSGMPKSRLSAMAEPMTSARSHAAMAISQMTHRNIATGLGKWSLHAWARSRPVTTPSLTARCCSSIAMRLEMAITHRSVYPNRWPAARSVAQLPGSMYPTATMSPGPVKAHNFRHGWAVCGTRTLACDSARLGGLSRRHAGIDAGPGASSPWVCEGRVVIGGSM